MGVTYNLTPKLSLYLGVNYVDIRRTVATNPIDTAAGYAMTKVNLRKEDFFYTGMYFQIHINNALNGQFWDPGVRTANGAFYPTMHPLERRNFWITIGYQF